MFTDEPVEQNQSRTCFDFFQGLFESIRQSGGNARISTFVNPRGVRRSVATSLEWLPVAIDHFYPRLSRFTICNHAFTA